MPHPIPGGETLKGRYVLVESGAATPSHNPLDGFKRNEGFPVDENGQTVNDRDYEGSTHDQEVTREMGRNYNSNALEHVPVVSRDGVVLSGNGRTMAGELAAAENTDAAYVEHLKKYGNRFGFSPEQVASMEHPRVVFVPDASLPYSTETFAKFNEQDMKGQNNDEQAVKLGKLVDDATFNRIVQIINGYDTMGDFYNDEKAAAQVVGELRRAGALNAMQYSQMFQGEKLSSTGRTMLENMLIGKAFEGSPKTVRQLTANPALREKVLMALMALSNNIALGEQYSLQNEIIQAIDLVSQALRAGYKQGDKVSEYARQLNLPFNGLDASVADVTNLLVMRFADILNDTLKTNFRNILALYNRNAADAAAGGMDLWTGTRKSKEDIIRDALNLLNNGTKEEQQRALNEAREQRKSESQQRRDGESTEQTGTAEQGAEPTAAAERGGRTDSEHLAERQGDLGTTEPKVNVSDTEFDEDGSPFVLSSDGSTVFGEIKEETNLAPAPIKLSLGNSKYGRVHIEKRHGEQIRKAGFTSVEEFVEFVANNYKRIRVGENSVGEPNGTYLLQLEDDHNNTLYIELSTDNSYWSVNSGGVFRKGYGDNKKEVWSASEEQNEQSATDNTLRAEDKSDNPSTPNGNVSNSSAGKGSEVSRTDQKKTKKVADEAATLLKNALAGEVRYEELTDDELKQLFDAAVAVQNDPNATRDAQSAANDVMNKAYDELEHRDDSHTADKQQQKQPYKVGDRVLYENMEYEVSSINRDGSLNLRGNFNGVGLSHGAIKPNDVRRSGGVELNIEGYRKGDRERMKEALRDGEWDEEQIDEIMKQMDEVAEMFEQMSEGIAHLARWNKQKPGTRPIATSSTEYPINIDYSFNCVKREAMNAVTSILVSAGKTHNLGVTQMEAINRILAKYGYLTTCKMCFNESKRKLLTQSREICDKWNAVVRAAGLEGALGDERQLTPEQRRILVELSKGEGLERVEGYSDKKTKDDKGIAADTIKKEAALMLNNPRLAGELELERLMDNSRYNELVEQAGEPLLNFFKQGQYRGKPILLSTPFTFRGINENIYNDMFNSLMLRNAGGVRMFSYADASPFLFFDYYQQMMMLKAARAPLHAYTKVPFFVDLFGMSGAMINQSLVVDVYKGEQWHQEHLGLDNKSYKQWLRDHAGLRPESRENPDKLVFNYAQESFPVEQAYTNARNRDYGGRVGITIVATSDDMVRRALADSNIHMVLPYHSSSASPLLKGMTGYELATDYSNSYNTKRNGKKVESFDNPQWGVTIENGTLRFDKLMRKYNYDARTAAAMYLECCEANGLTPAFAQFKDDENYYKLLANFRAYDEDGNAVRQKAVTAELPADWQSRLAPYLGERAGDVDAVKHIMENKAMMDEIERATAHVSIENEEWNSLRKLLGDIYGTDKVHVLDDAEFDAALDRHTEQGRAQMLRDSGGTVLGFAVNDEIYLSSSHNNAHTPMHEHCHIFIKVLREANPKLYRRGMELWKSRTEVWESVKSELEALGETPTDDKILSEIISRVGGDINEEAVRRFSGVSDKSFLERAVSWLREFWQGMKSAFGKWTARDLDKLTAEQFAQMPVRAVYDAEERKTYKNQLKLIRGGVDSNVEMNANATQAGAVSEPEAQLRDALTQKLREAGIEVVTDVKEGQRVLDEARRAAEVLAEMKKSASEIAVPGESSPFKATVISDADGAKVVQNLEKFAKEAGNITLEGKKNFLGELAKAIGARRHGSSSQYATFETANGQIVTIRLADHNAHTSGFDNEGRDNGISIVISRKPNTGIKDDGSAHVVEFFYSDKQLRKSDGQPYAQIVRSLQQALYSGEYNDTTGLAKPQEVNADTIREMRVWHGSGADFDAFDHSHMGEGEGAQAYGWGTYVTEVEGIGKAYAESMAHRKRPVVTVPSQYSSARHFVEDAIVRSRGNAEQAAQKLNVLLEQRETALAEDRFPNTDRRLDKYERETLEDSVLQLRKAIEAINSGSYNVVGDYTARVLYQVEILGKDEANYIDYTARMGDQGDHLNTIGNRLAAQGWQRQEVSGMVHFTKGNKKIVLNPNQRGADLYYELSEALGGDKAASEFLHECGFTGIEYPAEHRSGGRTDGAKNYVIFNEGDLKITDKIRYFRTSSGEVYGFTQGGKVYLDPRVATAETPIHEYSHLWAQALREGNPKQWSNVVELMRGTPAWDEVTRLYPEMTDDDEIAEEVLAHYSGRRGATRLRAAQEAALRKANGAVEQADVITVFDKVKRAIKQFWEAFANFMNLPYKTAEEVADHVMADLLDGVNPQETLDKHRRNPHKAAQLDIVTSENVMLDDYHTGIRSIDDIKTFGEAVNEGEGIDSYPDFTSDDAERALQQGRITIYSSKPIANGVFVSTSRMEAEEYAGGGNVYSRDVPLEDVAWIYASEGQYAKVDTQSQHTGETSTPNIRFRNASGENEAKEFHDVIDEIFDNAEFTPSEHARERYDLGSTPDWMKRIGITGDNFSLSFKNIKVHRGKDSDHDLSREEWHQLPEAIKHPFAITRYNGTNDRFRLYVNIEHDGKFVAVGVDVKRVNQGKGKPMLEVNSIKTVFAHHGEIGGNEELVTYDKKITQEQQALLRGLNFREYPTIQELSAANVVENSDSANKNSEKSTDPAAEEGDVRFSERKEPAPKVTKKGIAVFYVKRRKGGGLPILSPKMLTEKKVGVPALTWLNADTGYMKRNEDGSPMTNTIGRAAVSVNGRQSGGMSSNKLSWRPGKHLAVYPNAAQFAGKAGDAANTIEDDVIFFEVEYAADPQKHMDYQFAAWEYGFNENGRYNNTLGGVPFIPKDSYYIYRTNQIADGATPMIITGAYKINRALTDKEAREWCERAGGKWVPHRTREVTENVLRELGIDKEGMVALHEQFDMSTLAPAHDESAEAAALPGYVRHEINWDDPDFRHALEENGMDVEEYKSAYDDYKRRRAEREREAEQLGESADIALTKNEASEHRTVIDYVTGEEIEVEDDASTYTLPDGRTYPTAEDAAAAVRTQRPEYAVWLNGDGNIHAELWRHFIPAGVPITLRTKMEAIAGGRFPKRVREQAQQAFAREQEQARVQLEQMAARLGIPVNIITDVNTIEDDNTRQQERKRNAKGWFSTRDGVTIVLPNNVDVSDAITTLIHEGVAHYGLRKLFGNDFDTFLRNVFDNVSSDVRQRIVDLAASKYHYDVMEATEEYLASLAETTDFDDPSNVTLWQTVKAAFVDMLRRVGLHLGLMRLNDNDLRYILWRSRENLLEQAGAIATARDVAMRDTLGIGKPGLNEQAAQTNIVAEEEKEKRVEESQDLTTTIVSSTRHGAKLRQDIETAKNELKKVASAYKGQRNSRGFLSDINRALGDSSHGNESHYFEFETTSGKRVTIRTSNHNVNGENIDENNEMISIVIKSKRRRNTYNSADANVIEYVYFKEKIKESDNDVLAGIATSIERLLTTGEYEDITGTAIINESDGVRFRDGDSGADVDDDGSAEGYNAGAPSLAESVTQGLIDVANKNRGNLQLRLDAMRAIGGNLSKLRQAMSHQRAYDRFTVDSIVRLARTMLGSGMFSGLSNYEVRRLISAINRAAGREDITRQAATVVDMLLKHHLKELDSLFTRLLRTRGSKIDSRGVEVQAGLDIRGQRLVDAVRRGIKLSEVELNERAASTFNRMGSSDPVIADNAAIEWQGLMLAYQYNEGIIKSKQEEAGIREEMREAKEAVRNGEMSRETYNQFIAECEEALRDNRLERIEAYERLTDAMSTEVRNSAQRAKEWQEQQKQRVREIQHNANSDLQGVPVDEHSKPSWKQRAVNWPFVRFFMKPLSTFNELLRFIGDKSVNGEGYLFNRFMGAYVKASEAEWRNKYAAHKMLDEKVSAVFGKKMKWGDLFSISRSMPTVEVEMWNGEEMQPYQLTQGNLLYIYAVNKMADGRMKLRRMGISEEAIDYITSQIDPRFKEIMDWIQDEFLVKKREEYNEVYERMFGAPMAAIENYFPLKINSRSRGKEEDIANNVRDDAHPSTITGSVIKRTRNSLPLDVTGADAFDVVLQHLEDMEHWSAFAEFNRDLNTLLSYKRFRNRMLNMSSVRFGSGEVLWENLKTCCAITCIIYYTVLSCTEQSDRHGSGRSMMKQ